jgi:hypothetical protein
MINPFVIGIFIFCFCGCFMLFVECDGCNCDSKTIDIPDSGVISATTSPIQKSQTEL